MKRSTLLCTLILITFTLIGCGGSNSASSFSEKNHEGKLRYADNLTIRETPEYTEVTVRNPWDTVKTLQKYILVPKDRELPVKLPDGIVLRTPISNALVYSTVHIGLISSLGSMESIGGVCNAEYVNDTIILHRIATGKITDCGNSMSPDMEKIIKLHPQVIMLSPFENNDNYAKVGELGIPILECADYMETSALGRAEWIKFYALLFGKKAEGEKAFSETESRYLKLKKMAAGTGSRPKVIIDQRYGQVWNVPGGTSTIGRLIEDAGGTNPFAGYRQSGSVALAPEKVLATAHDADIWFVRYNQNQEKTLNELASDAPVNSRFKAYKTGNVYGCNTRNVNFYEETPFHPDRLLEDFVRAIHPELKDIGDNYHYYTKMK